MGEKVRYEIDPFNRLVSKSGRSSLVKERRVMDGTFRIDDRGRLSYRVKSPAASDRSGPYQVRLDGTWSITPNHDLKIDLDRACGGASGDSLTISGEILGAGSDSLAFAVTTKRADGVFSTYILELGGIWQVDGSNRLSFRVRRDSGPQEALTFEAAWELDRANRIVYRYEKESRRKGEKVTRSFALKGEWRFTERGALLYEVGSATGRAIDLKAALAGCGKDFIKYEIGISLENRKRPVRRLVTFYGSWRISRTAGLSFDVECEKGRVAAVSFSADAKLTDNDTVIFTIKDNIPSRDNAIRIELSHKILKGDGAAFVRFMRSCDESNVVLGAGFRW